ncbi:MAG: hypothetical protein JOZ80_05780 [Acidobacteriaceae bacterium]|nr:hypothetical protein [Acidobacteriaceae bacterium]
MSEASDQMMALLQELAGLKEIDSTQRPRTRQQKAEATERQRRRREIHRQIKAAAKRNKMSDAKL